MKVISVNEATHANHHGYSDVKPFEILKVVSEKTIVIRRMDCELLNMGDLKFHQGGFFANCSNQYDQKYEYSSNEENEVIRIRLQKDGRWKDSYGCLYILNNKPIRFYDFNF